MAAPSAAPVSDPHAALKPHQRLTTAQEVKLQLARDYPPGALAWVDKIQWQQSPVRVPVDRIDRTTGDTDWNAAASDKPKIAAFASRIRAGVRKPIVLIRHPDSKLLFAVDGHTRVLASAAIGEPVTAWVGTSKTADGGWRTVHRRKTN